MNKPFLLSSYGLPGSGKTYFMKRFALDSGAFYFQLDEYRAQVYDSPSFKMSETKSLARHIDPIIRQLLEQGFSVVYDSSLNEPEVRQQFRDLAEASNAEFHLLWFSVDEQTALDRLHSRQHTLDGKWRTNPTDVYRRKKKYNSQPEEGEFLLKLDTSKSYDELCSEVVTALN